MSRTENTFFRQALLKRMLLEADSLSMPAGRTAESPEKPAVVCSPRSPHLSTPHPPLAKATEATSSLSQACMLSLPQLNTLPIFQS